MSCSFMVAWGTLRLDADKQTDTLRGMKCTGCIQLFAARAQLLSTLDYVLRYLH